MIVTVKHRPNNDNSPKIFLLEVTRDEVCWQVLKRYRQFRELHSAFKKTELVGYKFNKFPRKHMVNSYQPEVVTERVKLLNNYCQYLISNQWLVGHTLFTDFVHSDIYLDSYQNLKTATSIRRDIDATQDLAKQLCQLQEDLTVSQMEHDSVSGKYQILLKNTTELMSQATEISQRLTSGGVKHKQTHGIKKQLHDEINRINEQYQSLRCHLSLTKPKQTQSKTTLEGLKRTLFGLTEAVQEAADRISGLEDTCLQHSWNHEEYLRLHQLIDTNVSTNLSKLEQGFIF